jgi:hypothetical protein
MIAVCRYVGAVIVGQVGEQIAGFVGVDLVEGSPASSQGSTRCGDMVAPSRAIGE